MGYQLKMDDHPRALARVDDDLAAAISVATELASDLATADIYDHTPTVVRVVSQDQYRGEVTHARVTIEIPEE